MKNRFRIPSALLLLAALLPLIQLAADRAHAIDLGREVASTPYDGYMGNVERVFGKFRHIDLKVDDVRRALRTAKRFRYFFDRSNPYVAQLPKVTEATKSGDCKAKSLWVAEKMGDEKIRFVVGKQSRRSQIAHAWLLRPKDGIWYALDPTNESDLLLAERIEGRRLFPRYSYDSAFRYHHPSYSRYFE